jgi:CO/xanthine dehydrogenase Mo-binding subunit
MTTTTARLSAFLENEVRVDGHRKVSGREKYQADVHRPGMLWAAYVTSPFAYAKIKRIDTSAAKAYPGVRAVLTAADIGNARWGRNCFDTAVLAIDHVLYVGDRVVAVAADTREVAETAARLVEVEYDELEPMLTASAAIEPTAPALHPDWKNYHYLTYAGKEKPTYEHPNIRGQWETRRGADDIEAALASAYRVFERRYSTPRQHCGYIEPHATLVWIDDDGTIHVQTPNKSPFAFRTQLAHVAGVPVEKVVVESAALGGDFGAKGGTPDDFPVYFLAKATGKPVRHVESYTEELGANHSRHVADIVLRTGVDRDGRIVAAFADVLYAGGAYAGQLPGPFLMAGHGHCELPYWIPNVHLRVRCAYTNTVPGAHVRLPGDPQTLWAWEQQMEVMAAELGIDPIEMRRRNLVGADQPMLHGHVATDVPAIGNVVLDAVRKAGRYDEPLPPNRGRGMALSLRDAGMGAAWVRLMLESDGRFTVITGVPDQGAGGHTVIARVAAAALGIDARRVNVRRGSTAEALHDPGSGAGRVTNSAGGAAKDAGEKMKALLEERSGLRLVDDAFVDAAGRRTPIETVARDLAGEAPLEVQGHHDPKWQATNYSVSAYTVEVEVDRETGAYRCTNVVFVTDVGTVINPVTHQGQIDGGFMSGFGYATMEDQAMDESGKITAMSLGEYKLPTIADAPPFRTVLIEGWLGTGPFGAKQVGEISTSGVPAAVGNAVANAVGVRLSEFPVTSERIYTALQAPLSSRTS